MLLPTQNLTNATNATQTTTPQPSLFTVAGRNFSNATNVTDEIVANMTQWGYRTAASNATNTNNTNFTYPEEYAQYFNGSYQFPNATPPVMPPAPTEQPAATQTTPPDTTGNTTQESPTGAPEAPAPEAPPAEAPATNATRRFLQLTSPLNNITLSPITSDPIVSPTTV